MITVLHQIDNINKELEIIKQNQMGSPELKGIITEMKKSIEGLNRTKTDRNERQNRQFNNS